MKTTGSKPKAPAKALASVKTEEVSMEAEATTTTEAAPSVKLKDLIARVAEATGAKKPQVREIVEATLKEIGLSLDKGETLSLLPLLGRMSVNRTKELEQGVMMLVKLRRGTGAPVDKNTAAEPLAEVGEQG